MANTDGRVINKVTYAPIRPSAEDERSGTILKRRRGLDKIAFVNSLRASAVELKGAIATAEASGDRETAAALGALSEVAAGEGRATKSSWKTIAELPSEALTKAGRALAGHRQAKRVELRTLSQQLLHDHQALVRANLEGKTQIPATRALAADSSGRPAEPGAVADPRMSAASLRTSLPKAIEWARVSAPERVEKLASLAQEVAKVKVDFRDLVPIDWDRFTGEIVGTGIGETWTDDLTDGFAERMKVEPIGRLHLERIVMTPAGISRGELLHSVGLAPLETVTLIHREWSSREVSFEKVVSEEFEQSTEEGVTENTELASATEVQSKHSSALSMESSATGSWGFASASATIGYNTTSDDETAKRDSRNHAIEVTRKASSRTRKEHKVTFTVKEQSGVEDQSVRTLTNPSEHEPMRVDFHQMVRKWKVDLYRYDLRLTYDIVVPAPGIDLLANVDELRRIDHQLAQPFDFTLKPGDITRETWAGYAATYGADVEPPTEAVVLLNQEMLYSHRTDNEAKPERYDPLNFDLPSGYTVRGGEFRAFLTLYPQGHFDLEEDNAAPIGHTGSGQRSYIVTLEHLAGRAGKVTLVIFSEGVVSGHARATIEAVQGDEAWSAWQTDAWNALRQAAEGAWQVGRQQLQQRRDQLSEEIARWDPLTLRRMEREEIMKTTLKWIFGPAFDLMPSEVARLYDGQGGGLARLEPSELSLDKWGEVMGLGEFIKFIHQAIEWENVLYFVYPYFWDNPRNHALKRFLHHPDSLHQSFLRGGAARVVLTVRPGFEEAFTKLYEAGSLEEELPDHPYLTIAQEIQNYAATNYPGIPGVDGTAEPSNEEVDEAERGKHIATWHEYTPVSALDISVNTPLDQLK